jgi:uncharacterized protein involved in exopolysaccharide biosynthesis
MNHVASKVHCSEEEISLYDIWNKLVQYKKVFWVIFFATFILGAAKVLSTPKKYNFSQMIEIGKIANAYGDNTQVITLSNAGVKIERLFFPKAKQAYNLHAANKVYGKLVVRKGDETGKFGSSGDRNVGSILVLSVDDEFFRLDGYKYIFQQAVNDLRNETKYVDLRVQSLTSFKKDLENRLAILNNKNVNIKEMGGKRSLIKIDELSTTVANLMNDISILQAQIDGTYNTRIISDFVVSDGPVGISRLVLLFLSTIASLFFGFFSVFVVDYIVRVRKKF